MWSTFGCIQEIGIRIEGIGPFCDQWETRKKSLDQLATSDGLAKA